MSARVLWTCLLTAALMLTTAAPVAFAQEAEEGSGGDGEGDGEGGGEGGGETPAGEGGGDAAAGEGGDAAAGEAKGGGGADAKVAAKVNTDEAHSDRFLAGFGAEMLIPLGLFGDAVGIGTGAAARFSYRSFYEHLVLTYSVIGSYVYFPAEVADVTESDYDFKRAMLGLSVGYEYVLFYEGFIQIGYGNLTGSNNEGTFNEEAMTGEVGAMVKFPVLPQFVIGTRVSYGHFFAQTDVVGEPHWLTADVHFVVGF